MLPIMLSGDDLSEFPGRNIEQWVNLYWTLFPRIGPQADLTKLRNDEIQIYVQIAERNIEPDPSGDWPFSRETLHDLRRYQVQYLTLLDEQVRRLKARHDDWLDEFYSAS